MAIETSGTPVVMAGGDGFTNGGMGFWGFLILAMFLFGGGAWGGRGNGFPNAIGYENLSTSNEVQRGFDNQNTMANQREILAAVNAGTARAVEATNETFHNTINALSDKYSELQRDVGNVAVAQANLLANQNQCCASINANATTQAQKILDAISENKIAALQSKVNELELQNALNGVVRYPSGWTYNAGMSPFCNCCGNIA